MRWESKKVLVTGAGGFIGSHLCEALLHAGAEVTAMIRYTSHGGRGNLDFLPEDMRRSLKVVMGNVEDSGFVDKVVAGQEVVFHLAALIAIPYSYDAPRSYVRTNVEGTLNVLEAVQRHGVVRMVHTSTSECYGTAQYTPIHEQHPLQGQSPYSASKIGADKIAESFYRSFQTPVATIRPFNTYGPRQSARAVIPTIISQALASDTIKLGALSPVRDFTFAADTARGFMQVAESDAALGEVTNVGYGKGVTIGELVGMIQTILGSDKPVVTDEERMRPGKSEVFTLICDNHLARERCGWEPTVSFEEGLGKTIDFISANPSLFRPETYTV